METPEGYNEAVEQFEQELATMETAEEADNSSASEDTTAAQEDEAPSTQTSEVAKEPAPSWFEDYKNTLQEIGQKVDFLGQHVTRDPQRQPQPAQQQQQENYLLTAEHMTPWLQKLQQLEQIQLRSIHQQEVNSFRAAEERIRKTRPDFDEVVPPAEREKAFHQAWQAGRLGMDWGRNFETTYKAFAYDKLEQRTNELAQKREQKAQAAAKAASVVPAAAGVHQAPTKPKLDMNKRGYDDAVAAFMAEMKAAQ